MKAAEINFRIETSPSERITITKKYTKRGGIERSETKVRA